MSTWVLALDGEHVCIVWQAENGTWRVEDNAGTIVGRDFTTRDDALTFAESWADLG